jgi:hypothetical protein
MSFLFKGVVFPSSSHGSGVNLAIRLERLCELFLVSFILYPTTLGSISLFGPRRAMSFLFWGVCFLLHRTAPESI